MLVLKVFKMTRYVKKQPRLFLIPFRSVTEERNLYRRFDINVVGDDLKQN